MSRFHVLWQLSVRLFVSKEAFVWERDSELCYTNMTRRLLIMGCENKMCTLTAFFFLHTSLMTALISFKSLVTFFAHSLNFFCTLFFRFVAQYIYPRCIALPDIYSTQTPTQQQYSLQSLSQVFLVCVDCQVSWVHFYGM